MKSKLATYSLSFAMSLLLGGAAQAQSSIAYFGGPAFEFGDIYEEGTSLDLDKDGVADFSFFSGPGFSTGLPDSGYLPYGVTPSNSNNVLCTGWQVAVLPGGSVIDGLTTSNTSWTNTLGATLVTFGFNGGGIYFTSEGMVTNPPVSEWSGPITPPGGAFLGVRFYSTDGLHYGWIHAQLPRPMVVTNGVGTLDGPPVILDWAYETRPNTAIIAGAKPVPVALALPQFVPPGAFRLSWQTQTNLACQIQFKNQLDAPFWINLGAPILPTSPDSSVDLPIAGAARFYRVVLAE